MVKRKRDCWNLKLKIGAGGRGWWIKSFFALSVILKKFVYLLSIYCLSWQLSKNDQQLANCKVLFRTLQGILELMHFLKFKMQSKETIMKKHPKISNLAIYKKHLRSNYQRKPSNLPLLWATLWQLYQIRAPGTDMIL